MDSDVDPFPLFVEITTFSVDIRGSSIYLLPLSLSLTQIQFIHAHSETRIKIK